MTHYKKKNCVASEVDKVKLNPGERITKFSVKTKTAKFIIEEGSCVNDKLKYNYKT
jgi:hypothetical protein